LARPLFSDGPRAKDAAPRVLSVLLVAVAVLVHLPVLRAPFMTDDYDQRAMVEGTYPGHRGPLSLYDFIDDSNRTDAMDRGIFPWFTSRELVVRFLRPLSSALLWADHELFGQNALLPHLHSLVWYAVACLAVCALLRQSFSRRVTWIGATVFALAPCHILPLTWLANREALVSTALGTLALAAYARWREGGRARNGLVACGLFALALLAGEYTLGFAGYVLAIELVRRDESIVQRARGLTCFALPLAAYVALHTALGYGAKGAGFYHDPLHDLPAFMRGSVHRLSVLVGAAWLGVGDGWWPSAPTWAPALIAIGLVAILAVPIARSLYALDRDQRPRAVWMLLGSLVCLAPALSVEPSARLVGVSMVGVSAVVALVIDRAWFPPAPDARRGFAELGSFVALGLAFVHFVLAPVDTWVSIQENLHLARVFDERAAWVRDHAGQRSTIVALRADSFLVSMPLIFRDRVRWRLLTLASGSSLVLRTSARVIEMLSNPRPLLSNELESMFRNERLGVGGAAQVAGMRVTVLQVDEGAAPRRIRFEFDRDLDDPSMFWITEGPAGFREQKLPQIGYGELVELTAP
jgi:hypothetical protein